MTTNNMKDNENTNRIEIEDIEAVSGGAYDSGKYYYAPIASGGIHVWHM